MSRSTSLADRGKKRATEISNFVGDVLRRRAELFRLLKKDLAHRRKTQSPSDPQRAPEDQ